MILKNKFTKLLILIIIWYSFLWLKDLLINADPTNYTFNRGWAVFFYYTRYLTIFIFVYASCFLLIDNQVDFKKLKIYHYVLLLAFTIYTILVGGRFFYNIPILFNFLYANTFIHSNNFNTLLNGLAVLLGIYTYSVSTKMKEI